MIKCGIFDIFLVKYFLEGRSDIGHDNMYNVLRSFGYNNSMLLEQRKYQGPKRHHLGHLGSDVQYMYNFHNVQNVCNVHDDHNVQKIYNIHELHNLHNVHSANNIHNVYKFILS